MLKQVIIIRSDLKMGKGKMVAQGCHASLGSCMKCDKKTVEKWLEEGAKKVVLKVGLKEMIKVFEDVKKERMPSFLVVDAGLTQLEPGNVTALGIGPVDEDKIDKITGKLKLL